MNLFSVVRNNWKKSAFATFVCGYGIVFLKSYYETTMYMRTVCKSIAGNDLQEEIFESNKIQKFSIIRNEIKWSGGMPKRVLVIINPIANKRSSEKLFTKFCEPLLHLAGYSVEILKTSHIGHAKTYVENMKSLPDAIVIAGGDGTSSEVVTGLMRRQDKPCPLALLPLGCKNESANKYISNINRKNDLNYAKAMNSVLSPMLKEQLKHENVIQYDVISNSNEDSRNQTLKPIFGLTRFSWGVIKDIEAAKDNYWYFGFFKHFAAALSKSLFNKSDWNFKTDYIYTPPCPGCRNCLLEKSYIKSSTSFLSKLISGKAYNSDLKNTTILNEKCDKQVQGHIETNQLNIVCNANVKNFFQLESEFINTLEPGWKFIKHIPEITSNAIKPSVVLESRTIQLFPDPDTKNLFYSIDGEEYDARPIKASLIPKAIQVYC